VRKPKARRRKRRSALGRESDRALVEQIRRLLAFADAQADQLPSKRRQFGCGSHI
jgi:hypothetical protein